MSLPRTAVQTAMWTGEQARVVDHSRAGVRRSSVRYAGDDWSGRPSGEGLGGYLPRAETSGVAVATTGWTGLLWGGKLLAPPSAKKNPCCVPCHLSSSSKTHSCRGGKGRSHQPRGRTWRPQANARLRRHLGGCAITSRVLYVRGTPTPVQLQ